MSGTPAPGASAARAHTPAPAGAASNPDVTGLAGAPAPAVTAPASARPRPVSAVRARVAQATRADTAPAHLRRLGALGLLAGVLTGATAFAATSTVDDAASRATSAAQAANSLAQATNDVAAARADATAAVIARETPASGAGAYARANTDLARAATSVAAAAAARGADGPDLTAAAQSLQTYTGQMAGAAVDRSPSSLTTADRTAAQLQGALEAAAGQNAIVVDVASYTVTTWRVITGVIGVGATAGLLGACFWLARKTHRVVNVPLAVGTVLVAGVALTALGATASAASDLTRTQASVAPIGRGLTPRSVALQSRLAEVAALQPGASTTLDSRTWEQDKRILDADLLADTSTSSAWKAYRDSRDKTLTLFGTDRTAAATQATTVGQPAFAKLDAALLARETWQVQAAANPSHALPWALFVGGVLGGIGAVLAAAGRLKEYR